MTTREIKFRAWDKINMKMIDGVTPVKVQSDMPWMIWGNGMNYTGTFGDQYTMETFIQLGQFEIMQYIGLRDKNGKEIYEGDIIMWGGEELSTMVVWSERYAGFGLRREGWMYTDFFGEAVDPTDCEVIGNIYENPELLK